MRFRTLVVCCVVATGWIGCRWHFDRLGSGGATDDGGVRYGDGRIPPANGSGGVVSGTRLRAMILNGDEGSVAPDQRFGLYDTVLAAPCAFEPAADGVTRCVPDDLQLDATRFADAACTQPVAFGSDARRGCYTRYVVDANHHVYAAGASANTVYMKSGASCFTTLGYGAYAVAGEIAPNMLVAGSLVTVPSGRLSYRQWVSDDGALLFAGGLVDTTLGADCVLEPDVGQPDPVCGPAHVYQTVFSDSACTDRVFGPVDGAPTDPFAIDDTMLPFTAPCALRTYHMPGPAQSPGQAYVLGDGGCLPIGNTTSMYVTDAGTIPRTSYASGAFQHVTAQRITAVEWRGDDGMIVPLAAEGLFDTQLVTRCTPTADSAGSLRCVPAPDYANDLFTDSSCAPVTYFFASCHGRMPIEQDQVVASSCGGSFGQEVRTPTSVASGWGYNSQGACAVVAQGSVAIDPQGSGSITTPVGFVGLTPAIE